MEAEGIDDIIGIAYAKDLVRAERVGKAAQPVSDSNAAGKVHPRVQEVSDLLREMQEEKFHMAIVVDEYCGHRGGFITLEGPFSKSSWVTSSTSFDVEEPTVGALRGRLAAGERGLLGR